MVEDITNALSSKSDILKDRLLANLYSTVEFLKVELEEKNSFIKILVENKERNAGIHYSEESVYN